MSNIELYDKISLLLFQMDGGVRLLDIMYESMNREKYTADMFAPAIYVAYEYFNYVEQALRQWRDNELPS